MCPGDVITNSSSVGDNYKHLATVLDVHRQAGITLKLKTFFFFQSALDYLGHVIRPTKLQVASKTCDCVTKAKPLRIQTELQAFLGLCKVYRGFVPNVARIAHLLNRQFKNDESVDLELFSG